MQVIHNFYHHFSPPIPCMSDQTNTSPWSSPLRQKCSKSTGCLTGWLSPMMACFRVESTGRMFFSTSSMGPGLWAIFSFKLSASRALLSLIWVAWSDGSAPVSEWNRQKINHTGFLLGYFLTVMWMVSVWISLFIARDTIFPLFQCFIYSS